MGTDDRSIDNQAIRGTRKTSPALRRLIEENAVGQLRRQEGLMATLGSENGALKLDWVEGVARLLADPTKLEQVETEARAIRERGIRHIIWAGMGGSVLSVRVFTDLGFCHSLDGDGIVIYPLDSTDPAALNEIVCKIARAKNLGLPVPQATPDPAFLHALFNDVMMIGVSMGMTSEEPITHLAWFSELLEQAQLPAAEHMLVMTLPGSYLDDFAHEHQVPTLSLQLDGRTGTGGRTSAPTTRVFLLPAALYLTHAPNEGGSLQIMLRKAWAEYNLPLVTERPAASAFVQLAAALSDASIDGTCRLLLKMPEGWQALVPWIEQLMEESLGKGGKGVVVFDDQILRRRPDEARGLDTSGTLRVRVTTGSVEAAEDDTFVLYQPLLASKEPLNRLAALAASFLGWQLSMALYGYLHQITFAGQPAVENYKARARTLRKLGDPFRGILKWRATTTDGPVTLLAPQMRGAEDMFSADISPALMFAGALQHEGATQSPELRSPPTGDHKGPPYHSPPPSPLRTVEHSFVNLTPMRDPQGIPLGYLDFTMNGELPASVVSLLDKHLHRIGNELLGVPVKLRQAPAAYHSTEQSEMDGPPFLVSLRLLMRQHEKSILGTYSDAFLCAQAISTWQAMLEQGRSCFLLVIDGSADEAVEPLTRFFEDVERSLS